MMVNNLRLNKNFTTINCNPCFLEAKAGERTVLFVDAAPKSYGCLFRLFMVFYTGFIACLCGRQRYNVLGAFNPINHEVITVKNETDINKVVFCEFLAKIFQTYKGTGQPITLVLDNARYQKCQLVFEKASELGIELLYLPAYSPNFNLIERLWRFVKILYSKYYETLASFKESIDNCLSGLATRFKNDMISLMSLKFQMFS
jgi:transposase